MKNNYLANKVKDLRKRKGISQERLTENSGLSLRTIQRIESGETNPTGETLKRIANALDVSPDELIDWTIKEDNSLLKMLNLSALTFLFFPLLGIIVPLIIWVSKKDKIKGINVVAKQVINFQITWVILLFLVPILLNTIFYAIRGNLVFSIIISTSLMVFLIMYIYNFVLIVFNSFKIHSEKKIKYYPKVKFLRD